MNVIRRVMSKKSESDSDYGCRSTLLRIIEDWMQVLDKNRYVAILMNLSKAFDCLPHDLLFLKVKNYGLLDNAVILLKKIFNKKKTVS